MQIGFGVLMFVFGAIIGSFLCCQVRRLHLLDTKKKRLGSRSVCLYCKKQLKWYENIPIVSWTIQGGKCRKCKKKIGCGEILAELGLAVAFTCVSTTINIYSAGVLEWAQFGAVVLFVSSLGFLAIYDGIYGELPDEALYFSFMFSLIVVLTSHWDAFSWEVLLDTLFSVAILGGIYLFLYLLSKSFKTKLVGDGDWLLGSIIAIALGKPWLALIVLFLSNLIACLVMYPFVKNKKNKVIYFGPFLVIAYIIAITFSGLLESVIL